MSLHRIIPEVDTIIEVSKVSQFLMMGRLLWAMLQSALNQEGGPSHSTERYARLLKIDITDSKPPGYAKEYVVPLHVYTGVPGGPKKVAAQTEILHAQNGQFLVLTKRQRNRPADQCPLFQEQLQTYRCLRY